MRRLVSQTQFLVASLVLAGSIGAFSSSAASIVVPRTVVAKTTLPTLSKLPTLAQLTADITAGAALQDVPPSQIARLTPSLATAAYHGSCEADKQASATVYKPCTFGDIHASKIVVLYGDSQAAQWQPAFNLLGVNHHYRLILVSRAACPLADLPTYKWTDCPLWKVNAMKWINSLHPSIVVLATLNQDGPDATGTVAQFAAGMKTMLAKFTTAGVKRVVLEGMTHVDYDNLPFSDDPGACMAAHLISLPYCNTKVANAIFSDRLTADTTAIKSIGVPVVSVTPLFCTTWCPMVIAKQIAYSNSNHTPAWYSQFVANALGQKVKSLGL